MARINIEDSLFRDKRFLELAIKFLSSRMALGALMEAFILAQKHYLDEDNDRLIPYQDWKEQGLAEEIFEVGLAEKREKGIYVRGSDKQFSWLLQKQDAGRKGGLARAKRVLAGAKRDQAGLPSYSYSYSYSEENTVGKPTSTSNVRFEEAVKKLKPHWLLIPLDEDFINHSVEKARLRLIAQGGIRTAQIDVWLNDWVMREWSYKKTKDAENKKKEPKQKKIIPWEEKNGK